MNDLIGQGEVHEGIAVFVTAEIRRIAVEVFAQTVTAVDHRRHTVKTETVEVILIKPELTVREQEMEHFVLAVVEAEAIPSRMLPTIAVMEILIAGTIEVTESLEFILHCMAVHEIHDHMHAATVRVIDESLQFIRRTETAGSCKEVRYMVAEGAVIGVLLDGHDLDAVIAELVDTRQHIAAELLVGIHFLLFRRHTDMAFVDIERALLFKAFAFVFPLELGFVPNLRREDLRLLVLYNTTYIGRNTLSVAAVPFYEQLVHLAVGHRFLRQLGFPNAVAYRLKTIGLILGPVIEIAFDIDRGGIRSPFAHHPSFGRMMKTEIEVTGGPISKRFTAGEFCLFIACIISACLQCTLVRLQIRITLYDL